MLGARGSHRVCGVISLVALAGMVAGCSGGRVLSQEDEVPLIQAQYKRMGGTSAGIYSKAVDVCSRLDIQIIAEREGRSLTGKMNIAQKPVFMYFKIASGDWVNVRFYNLTRAEEEKWREKFLRELDGKVRGTPAERERTGRSRRG